MSGAVVIGLGDRVAEGDEGVGPAVVQALRRLGPTSAALEVCGGEATQLCDLWDRADLVVLVDAGAAASPHPGRVHRRSLRHPSMEFTVAPSRHAQTVRDALTLSAALDRLPQTLLLYSIDTSPGPSAPGAVQSAVGSLAAEIADELAARTDRRGSGLR